MTPFVETKMAAPDPLLPVTAANRPLAKDTAFKLAVVPEVCAYQLLPSEEVKITPPEPTATNSLLPKVTPLKVSDDGGREAEVAGFQVMPSAEMRMVPAEPTATKSGVPDRVLP